MHYPFRKENILFPDIVRVRDKDEVHQPPFGDLRDMRQVFGADAGLGMCFGGWHQAPIWRPDGLKNNPFFIFSCIHGPDSPFGKQDDI